MIKKRPFDLGKNSYSNQRNTLFFSHITLIRFVFSARPAALEATAVVFGPFFFFFFASMVLVTEEGGKRTENTDEEGLVDQFVALRIHQVELERQAASLLSFLMSELQEAWENTRHGRCTNADVTRALGPSITAHSHTFVHILLSEALERTFDRHLLHTSTPAELQFAGRRVFSQDVPELQAVWVDVGTLQVLLCDLSRRPYKYTKHVFRRKSVWPNWILITPLFFL